jgi:hypothetical protein
LRRLRQENLDFVDRAPKRLVFTAPVSASPDAVFAALSGEPGGWLDWFPGLSQARMEGDQRVVVIGRTTYRETILVTEAPARWAFRIDETNAPIARALVEEWRVAPSVQGSVVQWTFCIDPTPLFRIMLPLAPLVMGRLFRKAMRNLSSQLSGGSA